MVTKSPLVSVCCLTYNHKEYIKTALDSILDQKVDFDYELIIHDDASTDGTTELIKEYAEKHSSIIKPILQPENLMSSGVGIYQLYTEYLLPKAIGKYIAICEGDDYWTDINKLQQQIDFLENNPQTTICFHKVGIQKNDHINFDIYEEYHRRILGNRTEFTITDLLKDNVIPNCSVVYRNIISEYPKLFNDLIFADWPLHLLYAEKGELGYINKFMANHRDHENGMWNGSSFVDKIKSNIFFYIDLLKIFDKKYETVILESIERYASEINLAELGKDFENGCFYGKLVSQKEIGRLDDQMREIKRSLSYRLSQKIVKFLNYFLKR